MISPEFSEQYGKKGKGGRSVGGFGGGGGDGGGGMGGGGGGRDVRSHAPGTRAYEPNRLRSFFSFVFQASLVHTTTAHPRSEL